ncbi:sensor histidine kinase [Spirosoma endophyticum]|uniref:Histidine kinase n=1 Tax=Spirosoma endophyticum TaxID=662367 RepID=A0A1I1YFF5_9BACT|nr:histidine kinase [Spirosoma endophyticum]SFE18317.1 Histidine kinase [Spirosoma endophyticum]
MQRLTKEFVFSNEPRHRLMRHGLFWLVWTLFFTFTYGFLPAGYLHGQGLSWPISFLKGFTMAGIDALLFMPAHMVFTYSIIYRLMPHFLFRGRYGWAVIALLFIVVVTSICSATLSIFVVDPIRLSIGAPTVRNTFVAAMMAGMRGGTTIGGFAAAIKLVKVWYLKQEAYQQIEREKLQAELQLLKSQIHPHFLFNTLNNLYALTLSKSDQSPAVVLKLSELLRYMLYECNAPEVPLTKEIAFMRNYIGLEQLRYGDRLDMSVTISGDCEGKLIAPLLLIPFLENAFKHGTSEQLEQAWMHVEVSVQTNVLKFKVINSREEHPHNDTYAGGIGLQNVQKRLQLLYTDRHELKIVAEEETFMIALTLELQSTTVPSLLPVNQLAEIA